MTLSIEYLPVDNITPYPGNARQHAEEDVNAIAESIKEFGFSDPVGVWGKDNTIVEGHGRLIAAKKLGITEIPVIRLDHMTDEQRRAYAIAHNKTAELSNWDFDALEKELSNMQSIDMERFGVQAANDINDVVQSADHAYFDTGSLIHIQLRFPYEKRDAIMRYMRAHKQDIIDDITRDATKGGNQDA